ncbi:hypothetical protein C8R45DRAFT_1089804 [Mycena sanguinolenta]|nr:hypothetical protein C8R45DRAFT_1089804 [Mycena sanguinolenta]
MSPELEGDLTLNVIHGSTRANAMNGTLETTYTFDQHRRRSLFFRKPENTFSRAGPPGLLALDPTRAAAQSGGVCGTYQALRRPSAWLPRRDKQMWPNTALKHVVIWADSKTGFHPHVQDNEDTEEWGEYMFVLAGGQSGEKI